MNALKWIIVVIISIFFISCAGIERMNAKRQTNSQLKLRLSQVDRELSYLRIGDRVERTTDLLEAERNGIERELLSRCEAGDRDACLSQFGR